MCINPGAGTGRRHFSDNNSQGNGSALLNTASCSRLTIERLHFVMSIATDQNRLRTQYRDATNLSARINLHARFSTNAYGWHRWVFDQFEPRPHWRVLELGCGPGTLWLKNRDRLPEDWDIMLSDFSPGMLEEARRKLASLPHPFAFRQMDAQAIPLPDASLDAVIANHMLYHIPDRQKAFAEIRRVLKPGGRLYAATNGHNHLRELSAWQQQFGLPDPLGAVAQNSAWKTAATNCRPISVRSCCAIMRTPWS